MNTLNVACAHPEIETIHDHQVPTILLIDDDPAVMQTIAMRLDSYAVNVIRRNTGRQGIAEAISTKPDLIITDWKMLQGEGEDVLSCVKENAETAHIPIIVLSEQPGDELSKRILKMEAVAFLPKPVYYLDLIIEVSRYVELREVEHVSQ